MTHKRIWTDEQREAARQRMAFARQARRLQKSAEVAVIEKVRDPEIQAILDTMSPERKAKLARIQSQVLSTKDGQEALARHEVEKADYRGRIVTRDVVLKVRSDGTMASVDGACVCGAGRREWHVICLRGDANGRE